MVETFFKEKRIVKKIVIVLIFIFMFNFTFSYLGNNIVLADTDGSAPTKNSDDKELEEGGGKLLLPIHALVLWIADAFLQLMQNSFIDPHPIIQKAKSEDMANVNTGAIVLCVIMIVAAAVAIAYSGGTAAGAIAGISSAAASAGTSGALATVGAVGTAIGTGLVKVARRAPCCRSFNICCCC